MSNSHSDLDEILTSDSEGIFKILRFQEFRISQDSPEISKKLQENLIKISAHSQKEKLEFCTGSPNNKDSPQSW